MTPEEIQQIIDMLAEKLGPMAEMVWEAYIKQVYVGAFTSGLWVLAGCIAALAFAWAGRWFNKNSQDYDKNVIAFLFYLGAAISGVVALCAFTCGCLAVLNPEYHAIQMLLGR